MVANQLEKAAPHDILQAWQDGRIGYRKAVSLTACDSLFELYDACRSSGVTIRSDLIPLELEMVDAVVADLTTAP